MPRKSMITWFGRKDRTYRENKDHKNLIQMSGDEAINGLKIISPCDEQIDNFEEFL